MINLNTCLGGTYMLSYCTNYLATMPEITIYMNCDTVLAINLRKFNLSEHDELVFTIKNEQSDFLKNDI